MNGQTMFGSTIRRLTLLVACCACVAPAATAQAQQTLRKQTALKFVPDSVSYFTTMLRNREQFDIFVHSKAFASLQQMPTVQMLVGLGRLQWENPQQEPLQQFKDFWQQGENQELLNLLIDAVSNEVFICGDEGVGAVLTMLNSINSAQRAAQIEQLTTGGNQNAIMAEKMMAAITEQLEDFTMPNSIVGFKISVDQQGKDQIARLHSLLKQLFADHAPQLSDRMKMEKINGAEFLTLRLDGSLIPWNQVPLDDLGENKEQVEKAIARLKETPFVIAIGVYQGYLLVSTGDDTDFLSELGKGDRLADSDEFETLSKAEGKRVVSIGYVSEELMEQLGSSEAQIDEFVGIAEAALPAAPIEESVRNELLEDVRKFADRIKDELPEAGAVFGFSYLTDDGYEGYSYNWAEFNGIDGSKPLSILSHLGGSPVMFAAMRGESDPEDYENLVKFLKRAYYYAEKIGASQLDEDDKAKFEKVRDALLPSLAKLDETTRDSFIPGLADGQVAFVLDAKSTSKQWQEKLPASPTPLPMFEPALVLGVSDAELVKKAVGEYFEAVQEILDRLHEQEPTQIPEIKLPRPKTREFGSGAVYYYPLPDEVGLDRQLAPAAGISDKFAVLSPFPLQIKRILDSTALSIEGSALANPKDKRAVSSHFNIEGFIDTITPWVEYGFAVAQEQQQGQANPIMVQVQGQLGTVLSALRCLGSVTSSTTMDDDVNVTHFEWRLHDLE